ncbi:geranylgeranyl transferase type-2 subunit alpha, putative [Entamoeba dispar SAW760]|uniref:Geranylgeranyl transferase type-2 subunit alpha n=1 Tax=Entamoeba dispar (strain ATCC PRA-260 / SAW760) TaxID=370354 RepID=B0EUV7_ENTDS|nr:geranylgeranyl transferase type-2 subunit alpha, putative [Entamoeba dispar SAW760]EDR21681.1 geranylgeranyl transferase type-2 subunit alpha, putative [Entamoeba dispar SAW760]|eukprot:EDR21681.1 geranylgeranyl transferase type-2 subunit alpha, putative [Entamoeba dispar SAW760]
MHGVTKAEKIQIEAAKETQNKIKIFNELKEKYRNKTGSLEEQLKINSELLNISSQDYQYWNERKEMIEELLKKEKNEIDKILSNELELTKNLLPKNSKSYVIWYHRKWSISKMEHPKFEIERELCAKMIEKDSRNFHCWGYYLWILEQGKISQEDDLKFITNTINKNFSNYSAWHHRSVIFSSYNNLQLEKVIESEFELLLNAFYIEPNDQSGWIYYRWLLGTGMKCYNELNKKEEWINILKEQFNKIKELNDIEPNSKWVIFTMIELYQITKKIDNTIQLLSDKEVKDFIKILQRIDKMRSGYYKELEKDLILIQI